MVLFRPHVFNLTSLEQAHMPVSNAIPHRLDGTAQQKPPSQPGPFKLAHAAVAQSMIPMNTQRIRPPAGFPPTAKPCLAHVLPPIPAGFLQYRRPARTSLLQCDSSKCWQEQHVGPCGHDGYHHTDKVSASDQESVLQSDISD
ncbi:hypothetical protein CFIO01_07376 [Colletotrichum fioriniae PJ7]|uniref:Uncharacterized protein n=1 Tax=Colletotrichum fioriniae PJ7 TaxID=1445577 RepID=A0A010RNN4_9PEZI|nr:hypothetical protein CFIO01_07376 [Colletotrichum fioriniae PJ7]